MQKEKLIVVSDAAHVDSAIPGGIQLCTAEYLSLLEKSGFDLELFKFSHSKKFLTRAKIKLGVDCYERYDFATEFPFLKRKIETTGAKYVALNQVALIGFAPLLRKTYGKKIKILVLSHGNESGDFLHEIIRRKNRSKGVGLLRDIFRLGFYIYSESRSFTDYIDVVLSLSETELQINNWLGAKNSLFVPRVFSRVDIERKPQLNRVGFVGSLHHKPNYDGLVSVIEALEYLGGEKISVRIVGGPPAIGEALQLKFPSVHYVGNIPDNELRHEVSTWALFLNPVFWYSRGASTKLAMGINWGVPVLSTPSGNRGYVWMRGEVVTVNSPMEMAEKIFILAGDQIKLNELSASIRLISESGPTMTDLAKQLVEILDK